MKAYVWTPARVRSTQYINRLRYFIFRNTGDPDLVYETYRLVVRGSKVTVYYYLRNELGKRYLADRDTVAYDTLVIPHAPYLPEWIRQ